MSEDKPETVEEKVEETTDTEGKTKKLKSASRMFFFSGLTFLLVGIISAVGNKSFSTSNFAVFLTIGIALIIVGLGMRQRPKNQTDN
ncbi:hypothetical protein ACFLUP_02265 [Chloroflexota bacterium]